MFIPVRKNPNHKYFQQPIKIWLTIAFFMTLVVSACQTQPAAPTATPDPSPGFTAAAALPTPTTQPTTAAAPVGILLAPANTFPGLLNDLTSFLSARSQEEGLRFQVRESLSEGDFSVDDIRWVAALPPVDNLTELASTAPETRFLAVGFSGIEAGGNLSVILPPESYYDQQGFMAGYIAAMITPDWRVGVISVSESAPGEAAREGFITGVRYFCGLCQIEYPPYFSYPLFVELPVGSTSDQWQSAASLLVKKSVKTIYVVPGAGDSAMYQYLANEDIVLIGGEQVVPEDNQAQWAASLRFEVMDVIESAWSEFLNSDSGKIYPLSLVISDDNPQLIPPGKLTNAERILEKVIQGLILLE